MKRRLFILLSLFLTLVFLAACGNDGKDASTGADSAEKGGESNNGGDLNIAVTAQPPTLDPHMTTATVAIDVTKNIFETLVASNENHESTEMLAESIEISDDGLVYRFNLREGVLFHNGEEMKSDDVEASMNRWLELSSRAKMLLAGAEFKAVDDYTVELHLQNVASDTLDIMAGRGQFPAIMPKEVIENAKEDGIQEYVGTGPFKFEEWMQDQYIKLVKFEDYVAQDEATSGMVGKKEALVDNLYFHVVTDSATRLAGLMTGEYDIADSVPYDNYDQIQSTDGIESYVFLDGSLNMFYNKKEGLMADQKMREMVNAAIDSKAVMHASFADEDLYVLSPSIMNPDMATWATEAGGEAYNQADADRAKQLMEEGGYNGEPIRLLATRDYDYHYNAAIVVKEQLEQLGMTVELEIYDWATLQENREDPSSWDIFFTGTGYVTTPSQLLQISSEYAGWTEHEEIDRLLLEMRETLDAHEAKEKWEELQSFLWEDYLPSTIFGHYTRIIGASEDLEGLEMFHGIIPWNVSVK